MICQTRCLLFDERPSSPVVYPAILRALDKEGGLEALFDLFRRYVAEIDRFYNGHGTASSCRPPTSTKPASSWVTPVAVSR